MKAGDAIFIEFEDGDIQKGETCQPTVWIDAFVAQIDEEKGVTIKALDPESCPEWMTRQEDGSINLFCFNFAEPRHKQLFPLWCKLIEDYLGVISMEARQKLKPQNPCKWVAKLHCVFGGK